MENTILNLSFSLVKLVHKRRTKLSENEWYFEYRYGPLMEPFEDEGLFEIKVSEEEFKKAFSVFMDLITDVQSPNQKETS